MPAGRPRTLDRSAIMKAVCEKVAQGSLVKDACQTIPVEPRLIREWALDKEFAPLYARARESQAHAIAEQALALADGAIAGKDGNVDKVRVQVDARKWLASKIAPRHYGDKLELAGDPERPVQLQVWQFGTKEVKF